MFLGWRRSRGRGVLVGACAGVLLVVLGGVTGCGTDTEGAPGAGDKLAVITAFYPLQYAAERIVGSHADVTNLTKPGAEPHDLELTPRDVATIEEAGLVIYLNGFQPAVDDSIAQVAGGHSLDVTTLARLTRPAASDVHEDAHEDGEEDHADNEARGAPDPHFWLDPVRLAGVGDGIAERLAALDPDHAQAYERNAGALRADLEALDEEFATGLATCTNRELVTSHAAFGYLAARYDLEQEGIAGLSPEQEPSPAELSAVATFVRRHDVRTIYYETLVDPSIADTLATETGADVAVLDPLEGLTDESAGTDYLSVMRANLATLEKGQDC
ncbi:zinc ABC transporter substrate-binding protein [Actinopolymorpha sp. B17G11]|uniref:metal ABC transporter substrate-binding protein n=1 Tax=Actinopolymorpha sp. B17G11 TaxID=3160861 RepID=UPI0032E3B0C4